MSVNWLWKDKLGYYIVKSQPRTPDEPIHTYRVNLYACNGLAACIYEPNADEYQFAGFWNDKAHLKACLGIPSSRTKTLDINNNLYKDVIEIRLNTFFQDESSIIAQCFAQAVARYQQSLNIQFYYEDCSENPPRKEVK